MAIIHLITMIIILVLEVKYIYMIYMWIENGEVYIICSSNLMSLYIYIYINSLNYGIYIYIYVLFIELWYYNLI